MTNLQLLAFVSSIVSAGCFFMGGATFLGFLMLAIALMIAIGDNFD